ncbi:hypothetical protein HYZ99_05685 [Candidatus Peregrinibacteria bacterium]|nr:hypothetical protein [Candidatus Peregrinibacteria bacterium]
MKKYLLMISALMLFAVSLAALELDIFPVDTTRHFVISFVLFLELLTFRLLFRRHSTESIALVLSVRDLIVIGLLKELFDALGFGTPDAMDLAADLIGITIPFVGIVCAEFCEIGVSTFIHESHPTLKRILTKEEDFFGRQWKALTHEGWSLMVKI